MSSVEADGLSAKSAAMLIDDQQQGPAVRLWLAVQGKLPYWATKLAQLLAHSLGCLPGELALTGHRSMALAIPVTITALLPDRLKEQTSK